jgi:GNAT superfamily N-acetyltransferase
MARLRTVVTYLEMTAPPAAVRRQASPRMRTAFMRAGEIPLHFYRYLQKEVGEPYLWWMRRALDDAALAAILHDPRVEIFVLYADGAPAGFGEIDRRRSGEAEIAYFGLVPERVGQGLGRLLMDAVLDAAWHPSEPPAPARVWLHTCNLDHPNAIGFYQRAGFVPYRREEDIIEDPRDGTLLPTTIPLPPGVDIL